MIKEAFEAARSGDVFRLTEILERDEKVANAENSDGLTLLGFAAHFGQIEVVRVLLHFGVNVDALSHSKVSYIPSNTALHAAIAGERHLSLIQMLLEHRADPNIFDSNGQTSLHTAAFHSDDVEITRLLVEHGADVHVRAEDGESALTIAKERGNLQVAQFLRDMA